MAFCASIYPPTMRDGLNYADSFVLNDLAIKAGKKDSVFIEVGSWMGHSSCVLGQVAKDCGGKLYCIDHWKGSPGVPHHKREGVFADFMFNINKFGVADCITPLVMDSASASKEFEDGVADLVFIDANHWYADVKQDIELWMPKIKKGGILCGHDCEGYYDDYSFPSRQHIDQDTEQDVSMANCHGGVVKALHDCFGKEYKLWAKPFKIVNEDNLCALTYTSMWYKEIKEIDGL